MKTDTQNLLKKISDGKEDQITKSAHSIRENGITIDCQSSEFVHIVLRADNSGLDIYVDSKTQNEIVFVPACITQLDHTEKVYNNYYLAKNSQVTIIAGCAIHLTGENNAKHDGIHNFYLEENTQATYIEQHYGTGLSVGKKIINPLTNIYLKTSSKFTMETMQIEGVDKSTRELTAEIGDNATLIIKERILTTGTQEATSTYNLQLNGSHSAVDLISRSVAKNNSRQIFETSLSGNNSCHGHSACDALVSNHAYVKALPALVVNHSQAELIHEAAIGKIAGEQLIKLQTLGLSREEAEEKIVSGFLK